MTARNRDLIEVGAARARELKETPISPESAARLAQLVLTGAPRKRSEESEPAA